MGSFAYLLYFLDTEIIITLKQAWYNNKKGNSCNKQNLHSHRKWQGPCEECKVWEKKVVRDQVPPLVVPVNPPSPTLVLKVPGEIYGARNGQTGKAHLGNEECPGTSLSSRPKPKKETQREQRNENK